MWNVRRVGFIAIVSLGALAAGCSHANFDPAPPVAASASPGSSSSPGGASPTATATSTASAALACGTPVPGAVYVAMGSYIEPPASPDPTYGSVYGYSLVDAGGNYPLQASPLVLRPNDVVQFTDVDPPTAAGANGASHSAAGLGVATFPPTHAFPSAAFLEAGTTLSDSALWSTGEIPAEAATLCYSQTLVVPASGTFYFGDIDFYNSVNMRDVIVASSLAAQ